MRVLVTGASGFIGRAFCAAAPTVAPKAVIIRAGRVASENTDHVVDLRSAGSIRTLIEAAQPDVVVHLAGVSSGAAARADLPGAHAVNVEATGALAGALFEQRPDAHFILAGSGLAYGASFFEAKAPLDESAPLQPLDSYAATKAGAELALAPAMEAGRAVTILRFFNVIGPGQSLSFAIPAFAQKIAEIERGARAPVIDTTRLDEARDFVDMRDAVRAIAAVLAGTGPRVYNVCSGHTTAMHDVLSDVIAQSEVEITVNETRGEGRPVIARGSPAAINAATGWCAERPLGETLAAIIAHHRALP